jgi:hypothetical protein
MQETQEGTPAPQNDELVTTGDSHTGGWAAPLRSHTTQPPSRSRCTYTQHSPSCTSPPQAAHSHAGRRSLPTRQAATWMDGLKLYWVEEGPGALSRMRSKILGTGERGTIRCALAVAAAQAGRRQSLTN